MTQKPSILISAIPFLFVLLWSTGFIGAKYALPFIEPFYLLCIRMLLTLVVFVIVSLALRSQWPTMTQATHQMVVGALIHGAYLGGVFAAIKWGMPAGIAAIIVGIQPLLTALLSWRFMGEKLHNRQWLGLAIGLIGISIVILSTGQTSSEGISWPAIIAALISLAGISIGTLYQKRFGSGTNLVTGSFWQYVSTAALMGILAISFETREIIWDSQLILALAWLVFGLSVTAVLLLMYMIREGESAKVASYFYLVPPVVSIEAWLLFGEALPPIAIIAIGVTVLGVFLVLKKPVQPDTTKT
uniref:Permease of the drug/metabolite transporter (DMT) superfamily n=1 Tax=uncultured Thiotrichaceae bacterium TaxID=298394 RepID=A0A6S6TPV3_9GAMM|nr:MAG: Permease of the drug/metabolite transporter (DMT) superfamily [uncultured Thiotrichaceae bacterium]